jgi:hypothetical protein
MSLFRSPSSAIAVLTALTMAASTSAGLAQTIAPTAKAPPKAAAAPVRPPVAPRTNVAADAPAIPSAAAAGDYEIKGFRSANFGATPAQVRAAIAADFGAGAKITDNANLAEGTTALQVVVDHLDPGPGAAQVTYIFGATSKSLTHVNVIWALTGEPTADQRAGIVTAAIQLANYFQTLPTPPKATSGVQPTGPNGLLMFAAVDKKGAAVEVAADGISYQATPNTPDGKKVDSPPPKGPAVLRVSYIANAANPDIVRIKPGAF